MWQKTAWGEARPLGNTYVFKEERVRESNDPPVTASCRLVSQLVRNVWWGFWLFGLFVCKYEIKESLLIKLGNLLSNSTRRLVYMDSIESNLVKLLDGLALQDSEELCDFTLSDQNEAIGKIYN